MTVSIQIRNSLAHKKFISLFLALVVYGLHAMKPNNPQPSLINYMPEEIHAQILSHLSPIDVQDAFQVCKKWHMIKKKYSFLLKNSSLNKELLTLEKAPANQKEQVLNRLAQNFYLHDIIEYFYTQIIKNPNISMGRKINFYQSLMQLPQLSKDQQNTLGLMILAHNRGRKYDIEKYNKKITFHPTEGKFQTLRVLFEACASKLGRRKDDPVQTISDILCNDISDIRLVVDLFSHLFIIGTGFTAQSKYEILKKIKANIPPNFEDREKILLMEEFLKYNFGEYLDVKRRFFTCVNEGKIDEIKKLLHIGVNPNFQLGPEATPLEKAIRNNNFELVKLLIASGARMDYYSNRENCLCLNIQTEEKNKTFDMKPIFDLLLTLYNPTSVESIEYNPLHLAICHVSKNSEYFIQQLIKKGLNINLLYIMGISLHRNIVKLEKRSLEPFFSVTALDILINRYLNDSDFPSRSINSIKTIKRYIKYGGKITYPIITDIFNTNRIKGNKPKWDRKVRDLVGALSSQSVFINNQTLLHGSVLCNYLQISRYLLVTKLLNVNAQDSFGNTALHYAVLNNNYEMCKSLINSGAKAEIKNKFDKLAFDLAFEKANDPITQKTTKKIIDLLLSRDKRSLENPSSDQPKKRTK